MNDDVWRILGNVLLAAFLGAVGQLFRVVVGLKKESDKSQDAQAFRQNFDGGELLTSLGIAIAVGAIAGVLASIQSTSNAIHDKTTLLALIGAGYSGTDFIEGLMKKALPGN